VNNDPKLATMLRFGVEGQHWNRNAQGRVELVSNPNVPAYKLWYGHNMGNLTIVDAPEELSGPNNIMLTRMAQINREAKQPALMGFVFDPNPVNTAVASCSAVVEQYQGTLNSGTANTEADVDKFIDEFNAKLKANGLDQILAEAQKQADAFLASRR
jgi:putative aldouronate transport system substrate-binding protein